IAAIASHLNASGKLRRRFTPPTIVTSWRFSLSKVSTQAGQAHFTLASDSARRWGASGIAHSNTALQCVGCFRFW
ncbi:hypothetical protein, partial [Neoroseomonas lacus]|uniref:hypothetical protein n=1 Tax=Neoroseomonas lacus TaxID=287609 RepID=UPI001E474425